MADAKDRLRATDGSEAGLSSFALPIVSMSATGLKTWMHTNMAFCKRYRKIGDRGGHFSGCGAFISLCFLGVNMLHSIRHIRLVSMTRDSGQEP